MCTKYNTADGCKFGEKCHFAHGERELCEPSSISSYDGHMRIPASGRLGASTELPQSNGFADATSFVASTTAKTSIDASLVGAIIGKGGANTKQICLITIAKLAIRDHESDSNLRNIELEGTFDQIKHASSMVRELVVNVSATTRLLPKKSSAGAPGGGFKKKVCAKGACTFGDRCHFAQGANELYKPAV